MISNAVYVALVVLLGVGTGLVLLGTLGKDRWGINLAKPVCPNCKTALPRIRKPKNQRQALWGGWTCPQCALELDKWCRPVTD